MAPRYAITMTPHSERRWFAHAIPIVFHCVLAAYHYVLSRSHEGTAE